MDAIWQVALLPLLLAFIYYLSSEKRDKKGRKYVFPPGPRGLPFLGNFFQIPHSFGQGVVAKKWADQYGEMYVHHTQQLMIRVRVRLAGTDLVYLNTSRVVSEILERRSAVTSSRQPLPMASDIVSGGQRIVSMPYNNTWRNIRKLVHQVNSREMKLKVRF
jgi:hypothetical protein